MTFHMEQPASFSECNFFSNQTIGLIMYLNMLQQQQSQKTCDKEIIPDQVKKMDEEISVNELLSIEDDILDNEDDMERWSDFSIEEELPMHSEC